MCCNIVKEIVSFQGLGQLINVCHYSMQMNMHLSYSILCRQAQLVELQLIVAKL